VHSMWITMTVALVCSHGKKNTHFIFLIITIYTRFPYCYISETLFIFSSFSPTLQLPSGHLPLSCSNFGLLKMYKLLVSLFIPFLASL